jgi:hypothetical protein
LKQNFQKNCLFLEKKIDEIVCEMGGVFLIQNLGGNSKTVEVDE